MGETSAQMKPFLRKGRVKLYRAQEGVHTHPGVHLWLGRRIGHLRLWPPRIVR